MAQNAGAVYSGLGQDTVTGTWNSADYGVTLPATDTTFFDATLSGSFSDGGFIGNSGVTLSMGRSFTDIKDMDGNAIDTIQTDSNGTVKFTAMELNATVLGNVLGSTNVSQAASTLTKGTRTAVAVTLGEDQDPRSHVFRMKSGRKRAGMVLPRGRITDTGDLVWSNAGAATLDLTIKAIPTYDSTLAKNVDLYLFLDDGVYAVSLVPVIGAILPSGKGTGEAVAIEGPTGAFGRFTGTTGVTFGGIAATDFDVVSDNLITAVLPTDSAGTVSVVVTNASGASAGVNYTRAA